MSGTIIIGGRLPCGIILELPGKPPVKINGQNSTQARSPIILLSDEDYGTTEIDAEYWAEWKKLHVGFAPLETGAIFEAKNQVDAKAKARELRKEKTGHEPMPQTDGKIKSADED